MADCRADTPGCAVRARSAGRGRYDARIRSLGVLRRAWVGEGFPDALGSRGAYALVDRESLTQTVEALVVVAVLDVGPAESFEGTCFLRGRSDVSGDGQRLGVLVAGLAGGQGLQREFAEAVERRGLAEPVAQVAEQRQGLLVAGGGGRGRRRATL